MIDLVRPLPALLRPRLATLNPAPVLYPNRQPDTATLPYLWIRPGNDLPSRYPSLPQYKSAEVLLDIWAYDEAAMALIERQIVFLETLSIGAHGEAHGIVYRRGRRLAVPEPTALHVSRSFEATYLDGRLVG